MNRTANHISKPSSTKLRDHFHTRYFSKRLPLVVSLQLLKHAHCFTICSERRRGAACITSASKLAESTAKCDALVAWCIECHGLPATAIEPSMLDDTLSFITCREITQNEALIEIPDGLAITLVDVQKDPLLVPLVNGRSELVGLALWLMKERKNKESQWAPFLATLPEYTSTPVLWSKEERAELLRGSPVLKEADYREVALRQEWIELESIIGTISGPLDFDEQSFMESMSVVLAMAAYLPTAQCFALLPLIGLMKRTGSSGGATLDYDPKKGSVVLKASRPYAPNQEVLLFDGRPNGELLLGTGQIERNNPSDFLTMAAGLVPSDRLYTAKRQVLTEMGFDIPQFFPIYPDRISIQQLAYLRLSRVQDPAQLATVTFDKDSIVSVENEYEILQLMMGDLREALQLYAGDVETDLKELQRRDLTEKERIAAQLRYGEKLILRGTMDGVRKRLAPIRGIPTKSKGMQDPNADLLEIFDTLESLPSAPKKLLDGIIGWARGDSDPEWKKKKR